MANLTQTPAQVQIDLNAVEASNVGLDSVTDGSDTQATALKKSGFFGLAASTTDAPTTDRAVMLTIARDVDAVGEIRHAQVVITEPGNAYFNVDDGGTLGTWSQFATTAGSQTLTNKVLTSPVINSGTGTFDGPIGSNTPSTVEGTTADFSGQVDAGNFFLLQGSAGTDGHFFIYNDRASAASRNWAITTGFNEFGDFVIRQSNAKDGNPIGAGTDRFNISATGAATFAGTLAVTGEAAFDDRILLQEAAVTRWALSPFSGALDFERYNASGVFQDKGFTLDSSGNLLAGTDNTKTLGGASNRWSVVYAGTGTINTSDARDKTSVSGLSADEIKASKMLGKEIGVYKWLSAVQEKGDSARKHIGLTVQKAIEIMESCNLVPLEYGFICHDEWEDEFIEHPAIEAVEATEDSPAVEAVEAWTEQTKVAGNRYGFRYDELLAFIVAGFASRLEALEG
jgi:hypothetical protein